MVFFSSKKSLVAEINYFRLQFHMMTGRILFILFIFFVSCCKAYAGNLGFGAHSGFGVIKYEEHSTALGTNREAESKQNAFLFGVSGEYSFPKPENFYAGITTDWAVGLEDEETWKNNSAKSQTNDMRIFGQFYDFRFGYKDSVDSFYYRLYVSGGWDGLHFRRSNFVVSGTAVSGTVTEDFSLWRTGAGLGLGYKAGKWALDGRLAYSYYPMGSVKNSSYPDITFDTNGTCLDMGIGIAREITKRMNFYTGVSYTLIELDESAIIRSGSRQVIFPNSKTEIILGVANLTYAF